MTMTDSRPQRILGVRVEAPDDIARCVSAVGNAGEKGSAEYALARREVIAAARELGADGIKALPADWGVSADSDGMEFKSFPPAETRIVDEAQGIVEAFVAVSGCEDKVADIIYPEALDYALKDRTPKGVWHHDWKSPIARTDECKALPPGSPLLPKTQRDGSPWPAEAGALWVKAQFNLGTTRGKDAFNDVVFFGAEQEWSIGYRVPIGGAKIDKQGRRHIKQIIIPEYSPVLFGAHPLTSTGSTKDELAEKDAAAEQPAEEKGGTIRVFLTGSIEELVSRVEDAVEEYLASNESGINMGYCWARIVGTFDEGSGSGRVVWCVMTDAGYDGEPGEEYPDLDADDNYFQAAYTTDADGVVTLADVAAVDVNATIVVKSESGETIETKVGKVISRSNMTKLKAALDALTALVSAGEPPAAPAAKAEASDEEKAAAAEQPHPYAAGGGKCATCGLSDKAAVHSMPYKAEPDQLEGDEAPEGEKAEGIDPTGMLLAAERLRLASV